MTNNYGQKKQFRPHVTENIGLIEQQKLVMIRDRSLQPTTSLPKGSHNQNIIVMKTYSPLVPSRKKIKERKKKGGLVLPARGQLY